MTTIPSEKLPAKGVPCPFHSPAIFFLMVILHLDWFVMSLSGVSSSLTVDLASMRTVCHDTSLKLSTSPLSVSLMRVMRRSLFCHVGLLDSSTMRDIWNEGGIGAMT